MEYMLSIYETQTDFERRKPQGPYRYKNKNYSPGDQGLFGGCTGWVWYSILFGNRQRHGLVRLTPSGFGLRRYSIARNCAD